MTEWILIIAMFTPGGDFIGKDAVMFSGRKDCEAAKVQLASFQDPLLIKRKGLCVTKDHWTGKKQMPGVAYD